MHVLHLLERNRGPVCLVCGQKVLNGISIHDRAYYFTRKDRCQVKSNATMTEQQRLSAKVLEKKYGPTATTAPATSVAASVSKPR